MINLDKIYKRPAFIITMSFVMVILIGTIILSLPISASNNKSIGFINALFTATSATCVTGLIVVNTALSWSIFGKIIILILIQIGGLGTMALFSAMFFFLGKKIGLKHRILIKESLNLNSYTGIVKFLKNVIKFSLLCEFIGAILLSLRLIPLYGMLKGIWFSIFHSVSAYCNAGFDLFGNSIVDFHSDILINLTICSLIIIGGLGFFVFADIFKCKNYKNLSLHTKLALFITSLLLILGTLLFIILERDNVDTIKNFNLKDTILAGFFQSTVARTAGFNSIDLSQIHDSTAFMLMVLMFIGASPASTGGGIKTTTFGVLIISTFCILKGKTRFESFKRSIKTDIIYKSIAILMLALIIITLSSFLVATIEHERFTFINVLFEVFSAFATVGTSRGITSGLSNMSHLILIVVMIFGRVGTFTVAYAITGDDERKYKYANGEVIVG
ncbi:MAG: TrkH family potassium uptake protein [Tissierellia bacterium]|nr:TrkH family potassium uptake protein [Tissierellia bacterium]